MPRCARKLKDAALLCIAQNIELWAESVPENAESYLYLLSPFEMLDHGLTQAIFEALIKFNTFKPKHIHLLFHQQLDSFDLSRLAAYRLGDVTLKTLFKRCKKIKSLILSGRTRFSRKLLNSIPLKYPNLQCLVTTHESITDEMISNLASSCRNLACFRSGTCSNISDEAFKELKLLENLRELSLGNADCLTGETLLSILKSCKKLQRLSLPMTSLDFKFLDEDCLFRAVTLLDLTLGPVDDVSMELITFSFPSLADICLSNCEKVTSRTLSIIANNCRHIESVNVSYTGIRQFSENVGMFLEKAGPHLRFLDLSGVSDINTMVLAKHCKRLEKLCMNHCRDIIPEWVLEPIKGETPRSVSNDYIELTEYTESSLLECCPHIVSLQIDARNTLGANPVFNLESILRGGHLTALTLVSIPFLTDNEISTVIECIDVDRLKHLNLSCNNEVTVDGIWLAINNFKALETIKISGCDVVPMEVDNLQKQVRQKGFEIQIIS